MLGKVSYMMFRIMKLHMRKWIACILRERKLLYTIFTSTKSHNDIWLA